MPTLDMLPGAVTLGAPSGLSPHVQSTVVGAPPQWDDGSDATYATVNRRSHDTEPWFGEDNASAPLSPLLPTAARVISVTITARLSTPNPATDAVRVYLLSSDYSGRVDFTLADTGIHTLTAALSLDDWPDIGVALKQADARIQFSRNIGTNTAATIYEASVTVDYAIPGAPPLRQCPRSDGLATSSARRMWPPSRSYQRGIRRAGGYL